MSYGHLTLVDITVLEMCMGQAVRNNNLRVLEIGFHTGMTARGIRDWCAERNVTLEYWGVDNGVLHHAIEAPFEGANFVRGDSAEVFHLVPGNLDLILVDGAHSRNHVILDTYNYYSKVRPGGFMLYHDTSPEIQHTMREAYGPDIPEFYNAVNEALEMIRWPFRGWALWRNEYEKGNPTGGMSAYRRVE